ncbi:hypothetical protein [Pseudophaeobacter sp.]|uniref:hypothetical protein n=1 Tax=Pseudophaeobacter sp. TaxID=1971739 RepID=UPI0032989F1C
MKITHTHTATLREGRVYTLMIPNADNLRKPGAVMFEKDVSVPVSAATKAHLEQYAVLPAPQYLPSGRVEARDECMFEFVPIAETVEA